MEEFIIVEFGKKEGNKIFNIWKVRLQQLISEYVRNQSKKQRETLIKTILPRIALYQILMEMPDYKNKAEEIMRKYMCSVVGVNMHKQYQKLENIPFFFLIFSRIFTSYTTKSGLWKSNVVEMTNSRVAVDIYKCLWHDACVDNGCPELCQYFCKCDDVTYNGLKKISFHRTQTLGMGGKKCDFSYSIRL